MVEMFCTSNMLLDLQQMVLITGSDTTFLNLNYSFICAFFVPLVSQRSDP